MRLFADQVDVLENMAAVTEFGLAIFTERVCELLFELRLALLNMCPTEDYSITNYGR